MRTVFAVTLTFLLTITSASADVRETPNVILITVDTFRPDHLGCYGYPKDTSPNLDRIAQEGILFEHVISSSAWTTPGLISALTGLYAPTHEVDVRGKSLDPAVSTLPDVLGTHGYTAPDICYLTVLPNFQNLGFQPYVDREKYVSQGDEILFQGLKAYQDRKFFLYYHYRYLHLPYDPSPLYDTMFMPEKYDRSGFARERMKQVRREVTLPRGNVGFSQADKGWIDGLYNGEIREMDDEFFGPLLRTLKELDLDERTLLIITADHGEELLDHGFIGHASTSLDGALYDEVIKIPLILRYPGKLPAGVRVQNQVQIIDVMPTILNLLDIPVPESVQGRSLLPLIQDTAWEDRPTFCETTPGGYQSTPEMLETRIRSVRTDRWKLVYTHGPGREEYQLYDLKNDPGETENAIRGNPAVADSLKRTINRWILSAQRRPSRPSTFSQEEVEAPPSTSEETTSPEIRYPVDGDTLVYERAERSIHPKWTGDPAIPYVVEYQVGVGAYHLEGTFSVQGSQPRFGPFPREFWNQLALYNPWKFRIWRADAPQSKSPWVTFFVGRSETRVGGGTGFSRYTLLMELQGARVFLVGLGTGGVHLYKWLLKIPPVDFISYGLIGALLFGILWPWAERIGTQRSKRWGIVLIYTLFIYSTLSVMPKVWSVLYAYTGGTINYAGNITVMGFGGFLIGRMAFRARGRGVSPYLYLAVLGAIYGFLLLRLDTSPAERLHLAEYGLLGCFVFSALRLDVRDNTLYGWSLLITAVLGSVDEGIQFMLPNRVFEFKDVGLNVLSGALGLTVIGLVIRPQVKENGER